MSDNATTNKHLLWLGLAAAGLYFLKGQSTAAAPAPSPATTPAGIVAGDYANGNDAAPDRASDSAAPMARPGYPLDGEPDIVFGTAAGLANCNSPNAMLDTQWGDGSRNVRLTLCRTVGQNYHIYVEELQAALLMRWYQGGFGAWDDMYYSVINDPGSLAAVLTAYNQAHPDMKIVPHW